VLHFVVRCTINDAICFALRCIVNLNTLHLKLMYSRGIGG